LDKGAAFCGHATLKLFDWWIWPDLFNEMNIHAVGQETGLFILPRRNDCLSFGSLTPTRQLVDTPAQGKNTPERKKRQNQSALKS
jgi:hypothetical protein